MRWNSDLLTGSEHAQVRKEITNFHQTKAYLKPLYKQLKKKSLELDILQKLYEVGEESSFLSIHAHAFISLSTREHAYGSTLARRSPRSLASRSFA